MTQQMNWKDLEELIKLKNKSPEEYNKFLQDIKEVMIDIMKISEEVINKDKQ